MIEKILLKNFQKHSKLLLEFSPNVTTIVGPTDCGKSAVIRALRFVCLNKLGGKAGDYIKWDKPLTRITLFLDGRKVTRERGSGKKGSNSYKLDNSPFKFDSVKKVGVPSEIIEVLKIDQDNFQRQLDGVFWLADGSAQIARNLNQIVNLEIMDKTLGVAQKRLRSSKMKVEVIEERLQNAREKKKSLEWVEQSHSLLSKAERALERLNEKRNRIASVGRTIETVSSLTRRVVFASSGLLEGLNAVRAGERFTHCNRRVNHLREALLEISILRETISKEIPDISPLLAARKKADDKAERVRLLEFLIDRATKFKEQLCLTQAELSEKEDTLALRSRNLICPKCGQRIRQK